MTSTKEEINISPDNVYGKCDLKCAYNFKYPDSSLSAKNEGIGISLTYDNGSSAPVTYNNKKYNVAKILIFSPSLHLYNNQKVDGEIFIEHTPEAGGPQLIVCIPLIKSGDSTTATTMVSQIISNVGSSAPAERETTTIHLSGFTLDKIIPKGPFFAYTGNYSSTTADFIVYDKLYGIPISSSTLKILSKILKPFPLLMKGKKLFLNEKGANTTGVYIGDDIYISCQPTGSSDNKIDIINKKDKDGVTFEFNQQTVTYMLLVLTGCILFILIFYAMNYSFNALSGKEMEMPDFLSKILPKK